LRQRQQVEGGLLVEHVGRFHDVQAERVGQGLQQRARVEPGQRFEFGDQRAPGQAALRACARQQGGIDNGIYDMSPARSKIGM
jgi:hypothetical protein